MGRGFHKKASRRGGQGRGVISGSGKQFDNDRYDQQQRRRRSKSFESSSGHKKGLTPPAFKPRPPPPLPDELAALPNFVKKSRFAGSKPGYFFSRGKMGVGYYIDRVQIGGMGKKGRARLAALITAPAEAVAQIPAKGDLQTGSSGGDIEKNSVTAKDVNSVKKGENERKKAGVAPTKSTKVSPSSYAISKPRETTSTPSGNDDGGSHENETKAKTSRKPKGRVGETRGAGDSNESRDGVSFDEGDQEDGGDSADSNEGEAEGSDGEIDSSDGDVDGTDGGAAADCLDGFSPGKSEKDGGGMEEQEDYVDEEQEETDSSSDGEDDERSNSSDSGDEGQEGKRVEDTKSIGEKKRSSNGEKKQEFEGKEAMASRGDEGDEEDEKKSFEALGVTPPLCEAAAQLGWSHATEIQRQSLPLAFEVRHQFFCASAFFDPP